MIRVTYDKDIDAGYIYLNGTIEKGGVSETITVLSGINLDFDKHGHLVGIELLNARRTMPPALAAMAEIRPES